MFFITSFTTFYDFYGLFMAYLLYEEAMSVRPYENVQSSNNEQKEKRKWFSVSLNRFELDDVSGWKIIEELVLKVLISLRVTSEYHRILVYFN